MFTNDFFKVEFYFFYRSFVFFFVSRVSHAFAFVHCCLVVTCWERADLMALVGDFCCILLLSHVVSGSGVVLDGIIF